MKMKFVSYLSILISLMACAQKNESMFDRDAQTLLDIKAVLDETSEPCPKELMNGTANCSPVAVRFEKKAGRPFSEGQRVLVIDEGMWDETYLTFSSRILDFVEPVGKGQLKTIDRERVFSQGAVRIFSEIIGKQNPQLSLGKLAPDSDAIYDKFIEPSPGWRVPEDDHGSFILATLAELNPNAEFVVSHAGELSDEVVLDGLCQLEKDSTAAERIRSYYESHITAYKRLIKEYGVTFINLSSGLSMKVLPRALHKCGQDFSMSKSAQRDFLQLAYEYFYKPLGSIPGVILVQAGVISPNKTLEINDKDFPIDCQPIINRVRVGEVSWALDEPKKEISQVQLDSLACIDVIINRGPREPKAHEPLYCASAINLDSCQLGTSYTAPLFLSNLLYLSQTRPELNTTDKLIQEATKGGLLTVKDPGLAGQFLRFKF